MCQRKYSIPTNRGSIQVSKGTFLTLNKRKNQEVQRKNLKQTLKQRPSKTVTIVKTRAQKKKAAAMTQLAKKLSLESSLKSAFNGDSGRMEQESTWSHINMAIYSMSMALNVANFDYHQKRLI